VRRSDGALRQIVIAKMSFGRAINRCDEQRAIPLFNDVFQAYLSRTERGERNMTRLITLLTAVSVVIIAAAPAVYAYSSLI